MRAFADLLDALSYAPARNAKLALLTAYFRTAPDPDRGYALAALTDGLSLKLPLRRILTELVAQHVDPVLYKLSRDYVGDTAETMALLWPDGGGGDEVAPRLANIIAGLQAAGRDEWPALIAQTLDRLDARGRWAFLKLIGGAARVGVSSGLAKAALARLGKVQASEIEDIWHAVEPPYENLFAWIEARGERPASGSRPHFRSLMLAMPLEESELATLDPQAFAAEWKWDGIRVQIACDGREARLFSRGGEEISAAFPEIVAAFAPYHAALDGELLVRRDEEIRPFNELQQRLNRKAVTPRLMKTYPAHVRLYDLLAVGGDDCRGLSFADRRSRLETWHGLNHPPLSDVSELIAFASLVELSGMRDGARAAGIEGLMLKRKESPYLAGRVKGHWYKWKRDALTLDCVLMYAQRGSGKRSSFYSDYTFGVWREGRQGVSELVPVGKAYSGMTDEELRRIDQFVRAHTLESFGPVRAVTPALVLEIAFDAIHASPRHKSGLAMRFPRIHRIRWDKPAAEADTLAAARHLAGL